MVAEVAGDGSSSMWHVLLSLLVVVSSLSVALVVVVVVMVVLVGAAGWQYRDSYFQTAKYLKLVQASSFIYYLFLTILVKRIVWPKYSREIFIVCFLSF